jgi:hypothetical protein
VKSLLEVGLTRSSSATGAPRGKGSTSWSKKAAATVHIGIDWLEAVAFSHIDRIGERPHHQRQQHGDGLRPPRSGSAEDIKVSGAKGRAKGPRHGAPRTPKKSGSRSSSTTPRRRFFSKRSQLTGMVFEKLEREGGRRASRRRSSSIQCTPCRATTSCLR